MAKNCSEVPTVPTIRIMRRVLIALVLSFFAAGLSAATARADELLQAQKQPPLPFPPRNELNLQLGYQAGFGGSVGTPSGVKLSLDYAYRFHPIAWFDVELANVFGMGTSDGPCVAAPNLGCYRGGSDFQVNVGVKLKFQTRWPLTFEVPLMVGLDGLYNRDCGDDGVAFPIARFGGRAKYWVSRKIAIGLGANFAMGPAFHTRGSSLCHAGSYSDFYGAVDILAGADFVL